MSLDHHRWLAEQLPEWEREGVVTAAGARRLRERYPAEPRVGLAQMVVGAMGGLLVGTGLIAVLAYNWDDFPRWARLLLALGPLAAAQAASWLVLRRGAAARPWVRESAALVQTLAAGAALALVSQIYNLPGRWTDLVFWWCIVAVPLAWVLGSHAVAIAYLVGIAVWTVAQVEGRVSPLAGVVASDPRTWYPLLLAGILPLWPGADLRRRPPAGSRLVLAATALVGLLAVAAAARPARPDDGFFWLAMLTSAAVLLFPLDRAGIGEPLARKPQVVLGGTALVLMALAATYEYPARNLVAGVGLALPLGWCRLLVGVVAAFAALAFRQGRFAILAIAGLAVVPLVGHAAHGLAGQPPAAGGWPVAIAYSLLLLAAAATLVALEFTGRRGAARIGAAIVTILVILRMADADLSLLTKGIAFIVVGCGFLAFNALVSRRRAAAGGTPA